MKDTTLARLFVNDKSNRPVEIVDGPAAPRMKGESWHYTTPGGKPIHYPNAYRWPKVYHNSTLRIVVGREWLDANRDIERYRDEWVSGWYYPHKTVKIHGIKVRLIHCWNSTVWVIENADGELYHTSKFPYTDRTARDVVREALREWRKKRAAEAAEERIRVRLEKPETCWVSVESVRSVGACMLGIEAWARKHGLSTKASHRLDMLLELDPDNAYLRLACAHPANQC
jgi:hypothetical protein